MMVIEHPDYDELPMVIKTAISEKDYCWLTDEQRAHLLEDLTNPDPEDFGD